jgi:hypothetical protein
MISTLGLGVCFMVLSVLRSLNGKSIKLLVETLPEGSSDRIYHNNLLLSGL